MRSGQRLIFTAVALVGVLAASGIFYVLMRVPNLADTRAPLNPDQGSASSKPVATERSDPRIPLLTGHFVDDSGYDVAFRYSVPIKDRADLQKCYESALGRADRGLAEIESLMKQADAKPLPEPEQNERRTRLQMFAGLLYMYEGRFERAEELFARAGQENPTLAVQMRANLTGLRGIAALRRGELDNCVACVGESSCIYPLSPEAIHQNQAGSRRALTFFQDYLSKRPEDIGALWLSHIARQTIGENEQWADEQMRALSANWKRVESKNQKFMNKAQDKGVGTRGANMLGGCIWDDFNGDHRPDLLVSSGDWTFGTSMFLQKNDGSYEDIGPRAGLENQRMAVNTSAADFDNDGDLDALLLRGGWETPYRMTLLRNRGDGTFDDVTQAAGLGEPMATQSAAWGDYDLDGDLDLYVAGEYHDRNATPLNQNRLYRNNADGTFTDVAEQAGVTNQAWAKGVVFGDYNDDGKPDLYVSNMNGFNRLYKNLGDGTFKDVAVELNLIEPVRSFSCWFWDYDNDGRLDLFVAGFGASLQEIVEDMSGQKAEKAERPRLYRNLGEKGFEDVTFKSGLNFVTLPMGSNYGDYDNDGFLDFYLATGRPPYSILIPNRMFRNNHGSGFEDTTVATGTGHLQKGHGVALTDGDLDGDLDLFVQTGGQTPADQAHNVYFENPGFGRQWLKLKLEGTKSNRSAIGAKIRAKYRRADGSDCQLHRVVGSGSSFGGNSLAVHLGLADAGQVDELSIRWPSGLQEEFRNLKAGQFLHIKEGEGKTSLIVLK